MSKYMSFFNNKLIIDCSKLCKYTTKLKVLTECNEYYLDVKNTKSIVELENVFNGEKIKLYINKSDEWFYIDKIFVNYSCCNVIGKEKLNNYIDDFEMKIGDFIYGD